LGFRIYVCMYCKIYNITSFTSHEPALLILLQRNLYYLLILWKKIVIYLIIYLFYIYIHAYLM